MRVQSNRPSTRATKTVNALVAVAALSMIVPCAVGTGQICVADALPPPSACQVAGIYPDPPTSCPPVALEDGACISVITGKICGLKTSENYDRLCRYQKQTLIYPPEGPAFCVDDGSPINFTASCRRAAGEGCGCPI